jgi:tricorn protease-like protein
MSLSGAFPHWNFVVGISGDGKRIVTSNFDGQNQYGHSIFKAVLWDAESGRQIWSYIADRVAVAISNDGKRMVSGKANEIRVWDTESGRLIRIINVNKKKISESHGHVSCVAISGDGKRVVSGSYYDGSPRIRLGWVRVWDAESGLQISTLEGHMEGGISVTISRDGKRIVLSEHGTVRVWNAESGQEICSYNGHANSVAISGDGTRIISGGEDGTVRVWDAETGTEKLTLKGHTGKVTSVTISGDGKRIISGGIDGTVRVWDAKHD